MATLDTSFYAVQPKSVADYNREGDAMQSNRLALQLQGRQLAAADRADQESQQLRSIYQGIPAGATDADIIGALRGNGFHKEAEAQRKIAAEREKDTAEVGLKKAQTEKASLEGAIAKQAQIAQAAGTATDQASWERGLALVSSLGVDVSKIPPQFDPSIAKQFAQQAMTGAQQLEQVWKQKGYDRDIARDAESARHNRASEGLTARGQNMTDTREREKLAAEGAPESGLPVLGVPKPAVTPWANQSNPKDANKVKKSEMERGAKEVEKDTDAARKESATADAAKRFIELNAKNPNTGGLSDKVGAGRWIQSMGSDYAEMEAITAKLAPAMREPGSGSTSDFDGKQFERATVGVDKPKKANENIATAIIARAQNSQDYADFRQTYLEQNGTLAGADRHWKDYVNKNPIFDPQKKDGFALNQGRKPWREHFKSADGAAPAPSADPKGRPALDSFNK